MKAVWRHSWGEGLIPENTAIVDHLVELKPEGPVFPDTMALMPRSIREDPRRVFVRMLDGVIYSASREDLRPLDDVAKAFLTVGKIIS